MSETKYANHHVDIEYDDGSRFITVICLHDDEPGMDGFCPIVEDVNSGGDYVFLGGEYKYGDPEPQIGDAYLWFQYEGTEWETGHKEYSVQYEQAPRDPEYVAPLLEEEVPDSEV